MGEFHFPPEKTIWWASLFFARVWFEYLSSPIPHSWLNVVRLASVSVCLAYVYVQNCMSGGFYSSAANIGLFVKFLLPRVMCLQLFRRIEAGGTMPKRLGLEVKFPAMKRTVYVQMYVNFACFPCGLLITFRRQLRWIRSLSVTLQMKTGCTAICFLQIKC